MHTYILPLLAALVCAVCNGTAAVVQKISADKEQKEGTTGAFLLLRLFQDLPYIAGVVLDLLGWVLTLYAVHYLPLFLVEALIASSIIITIAIERIFLHVHLERHIYSAATVVLLGLVVLAIAASPEGADQVSQTIRWLIIFSPFLIGIIGFFVAQSKRYLATIALAVLSGIGFGATSVIGRIFNPSHPLWHTVYSPLILGVIISGVTGLWLFSLALQRARASIVNASMTGAQTLIPAIVGIALLGDEPRHGLWSLVVVGTVLVLGGVSMLAFKARDQSAAN